VADCFKNIANFSSDHNYDGVFTISDFLHNAWEGFLIPSKAAVFLLYDLTGPFFEFDCFSYQSWGGVVFSAFILGLVILGFLSESQSKRPVDTE
jgi:hypothetical protein